MPAAKISLVSIVALQLFFHIIVFSDSFGLADMPYFAEQIAIPLGILWVISSLLFILFALSYIFDKSWCWIAAIDAVTLSQLLIIISWNEAWFGTLPNAVILLATITGYSFWKFKTQTERAMRSIFPEENSVDRSVPTEEMIERLPFPVRKWLKKSGVAGREMIYGVYLKQRGKMRLKPDWKWMESEADQFINAGNPSFVWTVRTSLKGVPIIGRDTFLNAKGGMLIKIAALFTVVSVSDEEKMDKSTMQRFLGEIVWFPTAALSPFVKWTAIDESSAVATMKYEDLSVSATFHFFDSGELSEVVAMRYKDMKDEEPTRWVVSVDETGCFDGILLPAKMHAYWAEGDEKFIWYRFEVTDIRFNEAARARIFEER